MLSAVWIQQRHRIPTTIFYIFYNTSLSDTGLFHKMRKWNKELRRGRHFKHNWFIRPSEGRRRREENDLGLTYTFNYCCQGVCFALLGKSKPNHHSYQLLRRPAKQAIKFSTSSIVQHLLQHKQIPAFSLRSVCLFSRGKARCMADKLSRMRPQIQGCPAQPRALTWGMEEDKGTTCACLFDLCMRCAAHVGCWHVMDCLLSHQQPSLHSSSYYSGEAAENDIHSHARAYRHTHTYKFSFDEAVV